MKCRQEVSLEMRNEHDCTDRSPCSSMILLFYRYSYGEEVRGKLVLSANGKSVLTDDNVSFYFTLPTQIRNCDPQIYAIHTCVSPLIKCTTNFYIKLHVIVPKVIFFYLTNKISHITQILFCQWSVPIRFYTDTDQFNIQS